MEDNTVKLTQAQLKEAGFENAQDVSAFVSELAEKRKGVSDNSNTAKVLDSQLDSAFEKMTGVMDKWATASNEIVAKLQRNEQAEKEKSAIEEVEKSALAGKATVADFENLSKTFGTQAADVALQGATLKSISMQTLSPDVNPDYQEKRLVQKTLDRAYILTALFGGVNPSRVKGDVSVVDAKLYREALNMLEKSGDPRAKAVNAALDTQTANQGIDWIPTALSSDLIDYIWRNVKIASLFPRVYMPTPVYNLPLLTGHAVAYGVAESLNPADFYTLAVPTSTPDSSLTALTAKKIAAQVIMSYEIQEDNIFDLVNMVTMEVTTAIAHGIDTAVWNGDTANTMDGTLITHANAVEKVFDGIRKGTAAGAKVDLATFNVANLRALRGSMNDWGLELDNLSWIASIPAYYKLLGLGEVLTVDKYGPNATIIAGEMGKFDGVGIQVSNKVYTNLNATGVYDNITTTKTILGLVNKRGYVIGDRRNLTLESATSVTSQQNLYVATWRGAFKKVLPTGQQTSAIGYNIA
jgi:HK97 family phage major capsid protein